MSVSGDLATMAGGTSERVFKVGSVPATPQYPYRVIGYSPNAPLVLNQLGQGDPIARFYVQHFARTVDGLEAVAAATFATFHGKTYGGNVIGQETATPIDRDPDDRGVLTTTHTYRI